MKFVAASRGKRFVATKATTQVVIQEAHVLKNISRGNDLNVCSCMTWPQKKDNAEKEAFSSFNVRVLSMGDSNKLDHFALQEEIF